MPYAARVGREKDAATHRVAGKEGHIQPGVDGCLQMAKHFDGIVLVVAYGDEAFRAQQTFRIVVRVEVREVSDIISARFQPVSEREFPEKPFAGASGKGRVENLTILSVGPVEADLHVRPPIPLVLAVIVQGEL